MKRPFALRALGWFWGAVAVSAAGGAGYLQWRGPLHPVEAAVPAPHAAETHVAAHEPVSASSAPTQADPPHADPPHAAPAAAAAASHPTSVTPRAPGTILPPDPALMEASAADPDRFLPRIGADRRTPMQAYAADFNTADTRPRVAVLVAGVGMNEAESAAAIATLPKPVSLAVSPYAARLDAVLDEARTGGHELLVSIPMEPQGFPLNDPGNRALLTGAPPAANAQRLDWALTRFAGYVGATGALGEMRGERYAAAADQMTPLLDNLGQRGLLYVDPRPNALRPNVLNMAGAASRGAFRGVDMVIDEPPGSAELDRALARLEQIARDRGAALGLAGRPSPVTVDRIATWALGLSARGVALAPVSVVVQMPQAPQASPPVVRISAPK